MNVLIISPETIKANMAGPSIRYYNFYLELIENHNVFLLHPASSNVMNMNSGEISNHSIIKWGKWCDVVITQGLTIYNYPIIKKIKKPLVIDLYDPFILENLEVRKNSLLGNIQYSLDLNILKDLLYIGDYFICSNSRQLHYWAGCLSILGIINPTNYRSNPSVKDWISLVPFGIPNYKPIQTYHGIRNDKTGIKEDDFVIVWGGGIWDWLDITTVIKTFSILENENLPIKLYIMGGMNNEKLQQIIQQNEINENVILGDWTSYDERHNFLMDGDLGIITHFDNWETEFSHRTRVLDYIWCNLPVITTGGDYISDYVEKEGFGISYESQESQPLVALLKQLYFDKHKIENMRNKQDKMLEDLRWSKVVEPLNLFCASPRFRLKSKIPQLATVLRPAFSILKRLHHKRRRFN